MTAMYSPWQLFFVIDERTATSIGMVANPEVGFGT
jgi:hypothetical protein